MPLRERDTLAIKFAFHPKVRPPMPKSNGFRQRSQIIIVKKIKVKYKLLVDERTIFALQVN